MAGTGGTHVMKLRGAHCIGDAGSYINSGEQMKFIVHGDRYSWNT